MNDQGCNMITYIRDTKFEELKLNMKDELVKLH